MNKYLVSGLMMMALFATGVARSTGEAGQAAPSLRANKASGLSKADFKERVIPQLQKGMTESQLQSALGTLPVLTGNGELLWVLKDGLVLTASLQGKEDSTITCWLVRADR